MAEETFGVNKIITYHCGMKKIKPTYPIEKPQITSLYGSHTNTSFKCKGKKSTYVCSHNDCGYSSRIFMWVNTTRLNYMESHNCPVHGDTLVNVGTAAKL